MLTLLTGPIRSGKTTALSLWCERNPHCSGLLSPDTQQGRVLFDLERRQFFPFQAPDLADEHLTVAIGRFRFLKEAFRQGCQCIEQAIAFGRNPVVLDEAGKLELAGEGFAPILPKLMSYSHHAPVIVVVRESLLESFQAVYGQADRIIYCEELPLLEDM